MLSFVSATSSSAPQSDYAAYVSIRQHSGSIRQHTSAYVSIRQLSGSIRQHTSAYVPSTCVLSFVYTSSSPLRSDYDTMRPEATST